ncbi:YlmH family RNA-binding protein [Clostridium brassicae]|uniref:YlmH/Sll1252 family protein n=1 Tax=Clostridium brassicae TaxID=2999072 RepID=A0ABT4DDE1_9CLOT|nr:YlmH/Sll1252 family protein [Clostridium brassicae]MCY6959643.1 YlmH/Sll1252 family protein [Clostridium brassicae]
MNKKEFIKSVDCEDKTLLSNIYDKVLLSNKINNNIYLNEFYPPTIWKSLQNISHSLNCEIGTFGVFRDSERRMISILIDEGQDYVFNYPLNLIKINNKSSFSNLEHSDYLGALMALGVKRGKFGDLIVHDDTCYVPVSNDICSYVIENLDKIGKCPCSVHILDLNEDIIPEYKFLEKTIITTSRRIDCVIAALCGISRNASVEFIKKGKVLLDYHKVDNKDRLLNEGVVITVRGYGKFKILENVGKTQKDRFKVKIKKYI